MSFKSSLKVNPKPQIHVEQMLQKFPMVSLIVTSTYIFMFILCGANSNFKTDNITTVSFSTVV